MWLYLLNEILNWIGGSGPAAGSRRGSRCVHLVAALLSTSSRCAENKRQSSALNTDDAPLQRLRAALEAAQADASSLL